MAENNPTNDGDNLTPEERERKLRNQMDFIVETQAKIESNLDRLEESQKRQDEQIAALTQSIGGLTQAMGGLTELVGGLTKLMGDLATVVKRHEEKLFGE